MDKYQRFLRNIAKEPRNNRARKRLMERELKKLNNNDTGTSDGVDAQISGRDTDAIDEVTDGLVEDYRTVKGVEDIIGKAGIGQSMLLEDTESLLAFKNGVMDAVNSLLIYLTTQEMANAYYEGNTN